jgi:GNAT superfamily N-acetyltransferase
MKPSVSSQSALSPLAPSDIPEVMRLERLPGYDAFIGCFDAATHAAEMASEDARYFGVRNGDSLAGFVLLQKLREPSVLLRRISVAEPNRGTGKLLLRSVMDWVFANTAADALELDVRQTNRRARHVYEREGFVWFRADQDSDFLSLPRAGWQARR